MFKNNEELLKYVKENYEDVTDFRRDDNHYDLMCENCEVVRGFQVVDSNYISYITIYKQINPDFDKPFIATFRCPVCKYFKVWIIFKIINERKTKGGVTEIEKYYKIASLPNEGMEDIKALPEKPQSLRDAYKQAIRSMNANAQLAAAAMFRRALQVITRDILKASPGNLGNELREIVGKEFNGIKITKDFSKIGYIIKEAGNQGSHPDEDPDLLDFTSQDAKDLRQIFMELVTDLFVVPLAIREARGNFLKRKKIIVDRA